MLNQGWECPRCHNCYSPIVRECSGCNSHKSIPVPNQSDWQLDGTYRPDPFNNLSSKISCLDNGVILNQAYNGLPPYGSSQLESNVNRNKLNK